MIVILEYFNVYLFNINVNINGQIKFKDIS